MIAHPPAALFTTHRRWPAAALVLAVWLGALLWSAPASADTLYHCRAYGGGQFWSRQHCQQHQALVERMASVPPDLKFEQQVKIAEQGDMAPNGRRARPVTVDVTESAAVAQRRAKLAAKRQARCERLERDINTQDSRARAGGTARQQQRIADKKQQLRQESTDLGC